MTNLTSSPRRVLWECGPFRFEEATSPSHLIEDSAVLGHCVGVTYDKHQLARHQLQPDDMEAAPFLTYWLRIRRGLSRIVTFTRDRIPVATLEYSVKRKCIVRIERRGARNMHASHPDIAPFCEGLFSIVTAWGIRSLPHINGVPPGIIVTARGLEPPTLDTLRRALWGYVHLDATSAPEFIRLCGETPRISIVITQLPPDSLVALPVRIAATHLAFRATDPLHIEHIEHASVEAVDACRLSLPSLRSGSITSIKAMAINLPSFRTGKVDYCGAAPLHLPAHRTGPVSTLHPGRLSLAAHHEGHVWAPLSTAVALPAMRNGHVETSATTLSLPEFRAGDIFAPHATSIDVPKMKSGTIKAPTGCRIHRPS